MYRFIFILLLVVSSSLAKDIKVIAFAQDTMANDYRISQVYEVRDALKEHKDIKFIYSNAEGRTSLLISQIERFIVDNVDVLIVGTNDSDAVVRVVSKAYNKGIKVIVLDRGINTDQYTTFINSDNIKIGKIGARYAAKRLHEKGKVLLFEGLLQADVTQLRTKGFMKEISKYKNIKVIKRVGNYLRRDAIIEMEKLLRDGIHVDAVVAQSDSMISGVRSALLKHKIDPNSIILVGCDYTNEARRAIRNSTQSASILFPLGGKKAVEVALKLLKGKKVKKHIEIPVKLITKHNVEKVKAVF